MIEFPEFDLIEEKINKAEQESIDKFTGQYQEEPQEKDELDKVLEQHTNNIAEQKIGRYISQHFIAGALVDKEEHEIRLIIENDIIIPRRILHQQGKLKHVVINFIIPKGSKAIRDDWGDEKTQHAIYEWLNAIVPEIRDIEESKLKSWIRLQLDYIRVNILQKRPFVHDNLYDPIHA